MMAIHCAVLAWACAMAPSWRAAARRNRASATASVDCCRAWAWSTMARLVRARARAMSAFLPLAALAPLHDFTPAIALPQHLPLSAFATLLLLQHWSLAALALGLLFVARRRRK